MDGRQRFFKALREVGIGIGAAFAVLLVFARGSVGVIGAAHAGLAVAVLMWTSRTPVRRLATGTGRPRPMLFASLAGLALASGAALSLFPEPLILVAMVALGAAAIVGLVRVGKHVGSGA